MSDLPATRAYQRIRDAHPAPSGGVARADLFIADVAVDELLAALAERDWMLQRAEASVLRVLPMFSHTTAKLIRRVFADLRARAERGTP